MFFHELWRTSVWKENMNQYTGAFDEKQVLEICGRKEVSKMDMTTLNWLGICAFSTIFQYRGCSIDKLSHQRE